MAITTNAELVTAIGNWLARSDLTSYIPDFVTLFEARAARRLKVRPTEASASLTFTSGSASLPSDFLEVRRLNLGGYGDLTYVHPSFLASAYPSSPAGVPTYYTIEGSAVKVNPLYDAGTFTLYYNAKNTAVSSALNWLFNNHPDIYLFGSLTEAFMFARDLDSALPWKQRTDEIFQELELKQFREMEGLAMRPEGPVV